MQKAMNVNQVMEPLASKAIDVTVILTAFIFNAFVLDAEWQSLAVALGGSVSGAVILAYFRRETNNFERFFKVVASAIGGLVLGAVLEKYLHLEAYQYRLGLFFVCSMLALAVLRALLQFTERNAVELLRETLQRMLNMKTPDEKSRSRYIYRRRKSVEKTKE